MSGNIHKEEIIFIMYDDVIKSPYPALLNNILNQYHDFYSKFLDLDKLNGYDMNNIIRLCVQRTEFNLFQYLAKTKFNFDKSLKDFSSRFDTLYKDSSLLTIGESLHVVMSQKFTQKVYFFSHEYDPRIHKDIQLTFGENKKITYLAGDMVDAINNTPGINSFILNYYDDIEKICTTNKIKGSNVLLARYGYNFSLNEDGILDFRVDTNRLQKEYGFKFASFIPTQLTNEHFTMV